MRPTVLIGLDGATFTVLDDLMDRGMMPFLRDFVRDGIRAELLSTVNPLTPPAWISMITGRSPGRHGVFDFIWAEQRKADHYFTLYNFRDIRCETIWSIVDRRQGRVGSMNFTMMSPPPPVNGYIIPGLVSWRHLRRNVHPREIYEELKGQPFFDPRELAWDFDLEKKAANGVAVEEYENWVRFHISRETQWFEVARYLMQRHPCDLTAILFDGMDKIFHMGYRFLDPALQTGAASPGEKRVRDLCLEYFRALDRFLAGIAVLAGPSARIFMASDHGFGPSWLTFRVNTWLQEKGYLVWRDLGRLGPQERDKAQKVVDNHFVLLDWEKTVAYARTVTSNGIFIRQAEEEGGPGVPKERYHAFRERLIDELLQLREPQTGTPIIRKVLTREQAYPGEHNEQAPDLTLVMTDYSFVSILDKTPAIVRRPEIAGTHRPEGIFLGRGPGVARGRRLAAPLSILDVAPTLLYSLGLDIPADFEGRMPEEAFEAEELEQNPVRIGAPSVPPQSYAIREEPTGGQDDGSKEIFEQLRALGYME